MNERDERNLRPVFKNKGRGEELGSANGRGSEGAKTRKGNRYELESTGIIMT